MKRTIPGLLLAAGWLLLLLQGSFLLFWGVVVLIGLIGGREFSRMAFPDILYEADRIILSLIITIPILATVYARHPAFTGAPGVFLAFCAVIGFTIYHYRRFENPYIVLNRGMLGVLFVGFLASHLVLIRSLPDGAHWLINLTVITGCSDSCAYWVGSYLGKRKLCPHISPNKTVEGVIGGIIGSVAAALLVSLFLDVQAGFLMILVLAVFLSIGGMIGDLLESIIKRGTSTKDSGKILGGHGGVLDRVDSLLMAAPLLYYFLIYSGF